MIGAVMATQRTDAEAMTDLRTLCRRMWEQGKSVEVLRSYSNIPNAVEVSFGDLLSSGPHADVADALAEMVRLTDAPQE